MKIVVVGTRGIPGIMGGVETHVEELYPRIVAMGHEVTVIRRTPYINENNRVSEYKGVKLIDVYAPKKKSFEAIVHTTLAIFKARTLSPDILHIHAIGPAIMTPLARLLGMKVVMTNHGPDYDRQKWGKLAKTFLKTGERLGARFSNRVIVISKTIRKILEDKYNRRDTEMIFNGVNPPIKSQNNDFLMTWGIKKPYIMTAGRFVKEKGFHDLIRAYNQSNLKETCNLVIAGDADHPDEYSENLKRMAREAGVILTGFIKGEPLNQLMTNAALFVLPSYHEGLPITLLEAMSFNIDIVASDIPANKIDELMPEDFFEVGNIHSLQSKMREKMVDIKKRRYDLSRYNWDMIAESTVQVYKDVLEKRQTNFS